MPDEYIQKTRTSNDAGSELFFVPGTGLEPAHPEILQPECSASANSAIRAFTKEDGQRLVQGFNTHSF
jgi:hypothetical protein